MCAFLATGGLEDNFTCPEGKVLPLDKVCDTIPDCKNAEDENECTLSEEDKTLLEDYDDLLFGEGFDEDSGAINNVAVDVDVVDLDYESDGDFAMDDGLDVDGDTQEEDGSDWFSY